MKRKVLYDESFVKARIIIYIILLISYVYIAYFYNVKCPGCPLCGMTRAVKSILMLKIYEAWQYNPLSIIFLFIIPLIIIDLIVIATLNYGIKKIEKMLQR